MPLHKPVKVGTLAGLLRQAQVDIQEFLEFLRAIFQVSLVIPSDWERKPRQSYWAETALYLININ